MADKIHARKNDAGEWINEVTGEKVEFGDAAIYHYGAKAEPVGRVIQTIRSNSPHVSRNAAIHVDQVKSFNKQCVRGTHYDPGTGNLISNSANAREREARRRGMSFS